MPTTEVTIDSVPLPDLLDEKLDITAITNSPSTRATGAGVPLGRIAFGGTWLESVVPFTTNLAQLAAVTSGDGVSVGGVFAARTSEQSFENRGLYTFGEITSIDNDRSTNPVSGWATFHKAIRRAGAGVTHGNESTIINLGDTVSVHPTSDLSQVGITASYWASSGEPTGSGTLPYNPNSSASVALGIIKNNGVETNPAAFQRGIVFMQGSLDGATDEALTLPLGYRVAWYSSGARVADDTAYEVNGVTTRTFSVRNSDQTYTGVQINAGSQDNVFGPTTDAQVSNGNQYRAWSATYSQQFRFPSGVGVFSGSGVPTIAAPIGSMYLDADGGPGTTLYVMEGGPSGPQWVAK